MDNCTKNPRNILHLSEAVLVNAMDEVKEEVVLAGQLNPAGKELAATVSRCMLPVNMERRAHATELQAS